MLEIKNLSVSLDEKKLLNNINLNVADGARVLLRGHNGSGKSTLANVIAGNPLYHIDNGQIIFDRRDITNENPTTRALLGIFIGAQNVPEIPGLTVLSLLKHSATAHSHFNTGRDLSMGELLAKIETIREKLNIPREWLNRSVNVGFSGGERKRLMLMRLCMQDAKFVILDEPDSGADAQTQDLIANIITERPQTTFLIISHQEQFSNMIKPTNIITLSHGQIVIE